MNYLLVNRFAAACLFAAATTASTSAREVLDFDAKWKFALNDQPGANEAEFDDSDWRVLDVPHDWAFEADYAQDAAQTARGGYKPGGIGWYRKSFELPESWSGKKVRIEFSAVYMNSEVSINGVYLGKWPYGYASFHYDLTKFLAPGSNVISVKLDSALEPSARWYHGCGIYGHVKLVATGAMSIAKDGVSITTPEISDTQATVIVETEVLGAPKSATLETVVLDPNGREVAKAFGKVNGSSIRQTLTVKHPQRWDVDTPKLYTLVSRIGDDETSTRFGLRTIRWDTQTGFWLNGKVTKLKGVADHLEAGPVGAAYPDELLRWKLQQLKDMGCNSIRTAHNPQTPVFYHLCDEMGILVIDELFDGWKRKAAEDYGKHAFADWWERDLRGWLKRDRNHPCVIAWSVGNETDGPIASELVRVCREMDPTRLVTSGHAGSTHMDIEGLNGYSESTKFFNTYEPEKPFVATEAPHTWQVRGYYRTLTWFRDGSPDRNTSAFPCPNLTDREIFTYDWIKPSERKNRKQIFNSSYDNATARITARKHWELVRDLSWHSGHFRWTGIDYLGEAGYVHGGWPFRAFMGGPLDLALFRKDLFYFYQSQWTSKPMVHILPHWTHPRMDHGTPIPVWVYSNCDEVELFLNGSSLGMDKPGTAWDEMQCDWMVPWEPGTLEAVGYKDGDEVCRASHATAGAPAKIALSIEGETCPVITVTQTDKHGVTNPYAENRIYYHIDGPARILSLESGNPVNIENNYGRASRTAFFGLARAFLQTSADRGDINVVVGAICGEKQVTTSKAIHLDVRQIAVRGALKAYDLKTTYSIDGSEPSIVYNGGFEIKPRATVKANVYDGSKLLFTMSEFFAPDEGLHWGDGNTDSTFVNSSGDQAEDATFRGAKVSHWGRGFQGKGYLNFGQNEDGFVQWYQENDGGERTANLTIRYSCKALNGKGREMTLSVNGNPVKEKLLFPNTKGWGTDWKTISIGIPIKRGANTIRLTTISNGGPYIDAIEIK